MGEQLATIEQLFGGPSPRRFAVVGPLPVKGCHVRIRSLRDDEISDYTMSVAMASGVMKQQRMLDANARLICLCLVDGDGHPFANGKEFIKQVLHDWDSADTLFLYEECARHVGLRKGDIESLAKNSDDAPAGEPSTD